MTHLNFIVATDREWKFPKDLLEMALSESRIEHTLQYHREEILLSGELPGEGPIPERALVYVHGNFGERYVNVGRTRALAARRPDLAFIIAIDPTRCNEEDFAEREDYTLVQQFFERERGFHARNQINVSLRDQNSFITGKDMMMFMDPIEDSLANYLREWKQLQGEQ